MAQVSAEDVARVQDIVNDLPLWQGKLSAPSDIQVTKMQVVSANKILVAEYQGSKVLVKFPMENLFSMVFDLHEQKLTNDMVSQYRGEKHLNPRVLLINDVCRVDEFVVCRTLRKEDYEDAETMAQLATQLAGLHNDATLKQKYIELKGGEHTIADRLHGMQKTFQKNFPIRKTNVASQVPEAHWPLAHRVNDAMQVLADEAFFADLLTKCFVVEKADLVFSHNDLSANNVLKLDDKVQIIDFDGSNLSYRGADIGYMVKNLEMHGIAFPADSLNHFVDVYISACVDAGITVEKEALLQDIKRGKVLALVFLMTMFGASDNWDVFHLTGFGFLETFPGFMQTIVDFVSE